MYIKRRSFVCVILAFFMLFSGMCLEYVQTDSSLRYMIENVSNTYKISRDTEIVKSEIYTTESLNSRTVSYIAHLRKSNTSGLKTMKNFMEQLQIHQNFKIVSNFYTASYILQLPELYSTIAVLNYIHNKDGKKKNYI